MQDKTINNALLALYRTGEARVHVDALMALRGIPAPKCVHDRPLVCNAPQWDASSADMVAVRHTFSFASATPSASDRDTNGNVRPVGSAPPPLSAHRPCARPAPCRKLEKAFVPTFYLQTAREENLLTEAVWNCSTKR
jgi:hypothetical protein